MSWLRNIKSGVFTTTKKDLPVNLWVKCDGCKEVLYKKELDKNLNVCDHCGHHFAIPANEYANEIFDEGSFVEMDVDLESSDPLKFSAKKKYKDSLSGAVAKTGRKNGVYSGVGKIENRPVAIAIMDFRFVGGSMGSVEGEKIARVLKKALELKCPAIVISQSGGARMQEGALSLMQMAKTSAFLARMNEEKLPFISILTHPTTGGVTASFAMLGDINIAEPKALIGFAGERVIKETIRQNLPEGFQRSEFLQEKGFVDLIVSRLEMRKKLAQMISYFMD
jgi:acetyl-CoA carboxylase carboxyl transferase subunit beta